MNGFGFSTVKRPAPAKKTNGYDVYHKDATHRVWVGFARTQKDANALIASGKIPTRKVGKR